MKKQLFLITVFLLLLGTVNGQNPRQEYEYQRVIRGANNLLVRKQYLEASNQYEAAFKIFDDRRGDLYNAACSASLNEDIENAYHLLVKSIDNGYVDVKWMIEDKDFENLKKTDYWETVVKKITQKFEEIESDFRFLKTEEIANLIPFKYKNKWGYMDKENRKVLVNAKYESLSFPGFCLKVELTKNNFLVVNDTGRVKIIQPSRQRFPPPPPAGLFNKPAQVDSTDGFLGFRVNEKGRISHISRIYDNAETFSFEDLGYDEPEIPVYGPYDIEGKLFALVQKNDKWGLINEKGEEHSILGFKFEVMIGLDDFKGKEHWFYVEGFDKIRGFINVKGEKKFYGEFQNNPFDKWIHLGVSILKNENSNGLLDLITMEWLIKPVKEQIKDVQYSHRGNCFMPPKMRPNIEEFYILVLDENGNEFFIGKNGIKYIKE
ncbi:MAG: hypothetical protein ACI9LN_004218 [Saprospiraceae bacterium]|jgi:hypothetical protein